MMRTLWFALLAGSLSACAGITLGPDYTQPPADSVSASAGAAAPFAGSASPLFSQAPLPDHWWRLYDDARLDTLVEDALRHNTDLRQASANLERVQAMEAEVGGGRKPSVSLNANPYFGHPSGLSMLKPGYVPPDMYRYSAGAGISYQLDLFGQLRRAMESAAANTDAARAALDLARVNVAAATTRAYAQVCSAGLRLKTAQKSVALQKESLGVSERLQKAGRVGSMDAGRARAQLQQLMSVVPGLEAERQSALYRLATLTGRVPQQFPQAMSECDTPLVLNQPIPVGDGAALIRRRPDVRQAERELAAASAKIGMNMADRYPKIVLGLSGASSGTAVGFAKSDTLSWSLGPLISWTLPNTGAVDARIAQAEAGTRMAAAKFDGTVLTALRETETSLTVYARELDKRAALQASRDEAAIVAGQARQLYQSGKAGYLDALDAERALASAEASLAASESSLVDDQVQLFLALGGGWENPPSLSPEAAVAARP